MTASSVLFVIRSYSRTGAQPIHFFEIIDYLAGVFSIHVLELIHGKPGTRQKREAVRLTKAHGLSHIITAINKAEAITDAIGKLITMNPVYPAKEHVSGFLWKNRASEYEKLISFLAGE
ncbi:MAG TPA: hypothetical protein PLA17_05535 [Bacteroidales bacterium]|nr:hypothetical protein [Bacteroidales bacterium]HOR09427.1 hypothetical protein [Bacteroidales bacterium]HPK84910.1 hypothetical protein [Bacteroidales bacterium]